MESEKPDLPPELAELGRQYQREQETVKAVHERFGERVRKIELNWRVVSDQPYSHDAFVELIRDHLGLLPSEMETISFERCLSVWDEILNNVSRPVSRSFAPEQGDPSTNDQLIPADNRILQGTPSDRYIGAKEIARLSGEPLSVVEQRLQPNAPLRQLEFIEKRDGKNGYRKNRDVS